MSKTVFSIDPGDEQSGWVIAQYDDGQVVPLSWGIDPNAVVRNRLYFIDSDMPDAVDRLLVEYTPPYTLQTKGGHSFVPNQVVLTAIEIGRFIEAWEGHGEWELIKRSDVKKNLLGRTTGDDAAIRAAIYDRYGGTRKRAVGLKATPGPLFGMKADVYAAFAVALTYFDEASF